MAKRNRKKIRVELVCACKYTYFVFVLILATVARRDMLLFVTGSIELLAIILLSDWLLGKNELIGRILNFILLLIYGVEISVLKLGGTYVTPIMLTNVDSLNALNGKVFVYGTYIVLLIVSLLIPLRKLSLDWKKTNKICLVGTTATSLLLMIVTGQSPIGNSVTLAGKMLEMKQIQNGFYSVTEGDQSDKLSLFYHEEVEQSYHYSTLDNPDIIVIFTEGLSQNVIEDERNLMPNVNVFAEKSIQFTNYYDHTAATYRGLSGQLFSGHQLNNLDGNRLISLQNILSEQGYETTFINPEPENAEFTGYLENMGFDQVLSTECDEWMTDRQTYEFLLEKLTEGKQKEQPQFIAVYTFGTHVSLDRSDVVYGDGSSHILNRFYNDDY